MTVNPIGLPGRTTSELEYLGAIADLLTEQNRLLADIANRIGDSTTTVADTAPQTIAIREPIGTPPKQAGRGASSEAWAEYAARNGVTIPTGSARADIIAACQQAGIPT